MNPHLKIAFSSVKPLCDAVMVDPSPDTLSSFLTALKNIRKDTIQEMQLYLLFPIVSHLKSAESTKRYELQRNLVDTMTKVVEMVTITTSEVFVKYHNCLLSLIFDKNQPGMVAQVPEELKMSIVNCLSTVMKQLDDRIRVTIVKKHTPLLAQSIFIVVHIAKLEKWRVLKGAAIRCVMELTTLKYSVTDIYEKIPDPKLEIAVVDMLSSILPGVLSALQDVATSSDSTGFAVNVIATRIITCLVRLVMSDKHLNEKDDVSTEDFLKMFQEKTNFREDYTEVSSQVKTVKKLEKRSPEWFAMAGDKLKLVTKSLLCLQTHEHGRVRKELVIYCGIVLTKCSRTMQPSVPYLLDLLIALSKDECSEVSDLCKQYLNEYFHTPNKSMDQTLDCLTENFKATIALLPRILNNIDSDRKLATLHLLHGYLTIMSNEDRPQQLTRVLTLHKTLEDLCQTLIEAAKLDTSVSLLELPGVRDIKTLEYDKTPWRRLQHLQDTKCENELQAICKILGAAECVDLIVDRLLSIVGESQDQRKEAVYLLNFIAKAQSPDLNVLKRILDAYIEPEVWYLPLEVSTSEPPLTSDDTLDVSIHNPRSWEKDSVPGLYEGAVEIRYTDISYKAPRLQPIKDPNRCSTLAQARNNLVLSCLLTEGVGIVATTLGNEFQQYLLKTLCMILERAGSRYELLHLSGAGAIHAIAQACGHKDVGELINNNADYFTFQITTKLKKSWNSESALRILRVVLEHCDAAILDCLYGIVNDVLVQSCDKYHGNDLGAYLQVFLTFVTCIAKWFYKNENDIDKDAAVQSQEMEKFDILYDTLNYIKNQEEAERLLNIQELEKETGKSAEEMYKEDLKRKEEDDALDYDDKVTEEKPAVPQHISMTVAILKRCVNFLPSKCRDEKLLAIQVINKGLTILREHEDELLPLVHLAWAPLVPRFDEIKEPPVIRSALELLVTMAAVSKDFIQNRVVQEVLPKIYKFVEVSSNDSYLKDAGSAYRSSHAYRTQLAALGSLRTLVIDLQLEDDRLERAMNCVRPYLSNRQPKPLQELAVQFFKEILKYDWGATWHHLRVLCDNQLTLEPPAFDTYDLAPVTGTPFGPSDAKYENNIDAIFDVK